MFPKHVIHADLEKHGASNASLSEEMDTNSVVSSLSGLDQAFQQLGRMPFNLDQHVKSEPSSSS